MNTPEINPSTGDQYNQIFDMHMWVVQEQERLEREIKIIEATRPSRLEPLENQIEYGRKTAEILGRHYELSKISEQLNNNPK